MILLDVEVIAKGLDVGGKLGSPQPFKPGQTNENNPPPNANPVSKPNVAPGNLACLH